MIGDRVPDADVPAALMAHAGGHGRLLWHKSKSWASATFEGSRDEVAFEYFGAEAAAAGEQFLANLHDVDIRLPGRILADAKVGYHQPLRERTIAVLELLPVKD